LSIAGTIECESRHVSSSSVGYAHKWAHLCTSLHAFKENELAENVWLSKCEKALVSVLLIQELIGNPRPPETVNAITHRYHRHTTDKVA
jgi:hypothetical protein